MTRILFLPDVDQDFGLERIPSMWRMLKESHDLIGLPSPWDLYLYDSDKVKWPRYLLYVLDKAIMGFRGLLEGHRNRVELVFCEEAHRALPGVAIAKILGIRCIWDSHGSYRIETDSVGMGRIYSRLAVLVERFLGKRVDAIITVTAADADAYADMGIPRSKIHVVPLTVDFSEVDAEVVSGHTLKQPEGQGSRGPVLLFFGSMKYAPNREALEFINARVAPFLEGEGVQCEIQIAGRDIPDATYHPSIKVLGFVPSLHECIRSADLCLAPVWKGGGTLTKVLDIMAVGAPVVLTAFAAGGIPGIKDGVHGLVASSKEEFLHQVLFALRNPEKSRSMGERARELIQKYYDGEAQQPRLEAILRGESPDDWLVS